MRDCFAFQGSHVWSVNIFGGLDVHSFDWIVPEELLVCDVHILTSTREHHDVLGLPSLDGSLLLSFGVELLVVGDNVEEHPLRLSLGWIINGVQSVVCGSEPDVHTLLVCDSEGVIGIAVVLNTIVLFFLSNSATEYWPCHPG
jgi:hypothetical protein